MLEHERLHSLASCLLKTVLWAVCCALAAFAALTLVFRIWGVPESWQHRLRDELANRGIQVEYRKLYIDAAGRLIIRDARWRDTPPRPPTTFHAQRIRCGIAWISWWRRQPFLSSLEIVNGIIQTPLDVRSSATLTNIDLTAHLTPEELIVDALDCSLLGVKIQCAGRLPWSSLRKTRAPGPAAGPIDLTSFAPLWRRAEEATATIRAERPILLRVELRAAAEPGQFSADATLDAPPLHCRGVRLLGAEGTATFQQGLIRIPAILLHLDHDASIRLAGRADLAERRAHAVVEAVGDPAWLGPILPPPARAHLERLRFSRPPAVRCELQASWQQRLSTHALLDLDWRGFEFDGRRIDRLEIPAAFDGQRLIIPEAILESAGETAVLRFLREGPDGPIRGDVRGTINPALFQGLLPAGAQPFMDSCRFSQGIQLDFDCHGASMRPGQWKLSGNFDVRNAVYKDVPLRRVSAGSATMDGLTLELRDVLLAKPEGEGTCTALNYNFRTRMIEIRGAQGRLHVQQTAHLFGGNFEKYCQPYRFDSPPQFDLDGLIDLGGGQNSNFGLKVRGSSMIYPFLGVDVPARSVRADVRFLGMTMQIESIDASVYDGSLAMKGGFDFTHHDARFNLNFDIRDASFERLMRAFFQAEDVSGTLNGTAALRGIVDRLDMLNGSGRADIQDGFLLKIPIFGGLSTLMNAIIPSFGYAKAGNAGCDFVIENGIVRWKDLAVTSATFAMICGGEYSIPRDGLDADARVNLRGPVGFMLFPVSKLFEYHGTGPLKNVTWGPKLLGH